MIVEVPRKLKLTKVRKYGANLHALLVLKAVPNVVPLCLVKELGMRLAGSRRRVTVADNRTVTV